MSECSNLFKYRGELKMATDEPLKKRVVDQLAWDTRIAASNIQVTASNGVITLTGTVPSYYQRGVAEDEADQTTGAVGVTNKLAVVPSEKITDEIIGERVLDRIDQNTIANIDGLDVKVSNGKVTLYRTIPSWPTWQAVYDAAQFTSGVTEVEDRTTISYS